jgi:galactokinase
MATKFEILEQLENPQSKIYKKLLDTYADINILPLKISSIKNLLAHPALKTSAPTVLCRCPGRLSFSKHADYINSDLLYTLDDRDIFVAGQVLDDNTGESSSSLSLANLNPDFQPINLKDSAPNSDWSFYPFHILQELKKNHPSKSGLSLVFSSDLPPAGGLSSSHALMISSLLVMIELLEIMTLSQALENRYQASDKEKEIFRELILLLQRTEHARGFKSGLGDQSAELFGKKNHFSFIKIHPQLDISYQEIPRETMLVTAPSLIKADKSLPEFQSANQNIQRYKSINLMAREFGCEYLGDLVYQFSQEKIYGILDRIEDLQERGLALYGLAESARLKNLKANFSLGDLGAHLKLSHQAEINYHLQDGYWQELSPSEKLFYELDHQKPLTEHSGIYRASTRQNDQLQYFACQTPGVYGSSLSGAGLGGNNIILARPESKALLIENLEKNFYSLYQKSAQECLHFSSSSGAAGIISGISGS